MYTLKYYFGAALAIPCLPFLYYQGRQVIQAVPVLPEAKDTLGNVGDGNDNFYLLTIGESTIAGVGVESQREGITGELSKLLATKHKKRVNWKVVARSGFTAKKINDELLPTIGNFQPDLIVLGIGANDVFKLTGLKNWKIHVTELLNNLSQQYAFVPIVLANMPPIKEFPAFPAMIKFFLGNKVEILGQALESIALNYPNIYFNNEVIIFKEWLKRSGLNLPKDDFFSDGVHPSALTYKLWAQELFAFIQKHQLLK